MKRFLAVIVAAAVSASGASAQDPAPKADGAKDLLKKGFEASIAAGGFTFTGSVDQESPFGGGAMVMGAGMALGPEGKCTGTAGTDGTTHVRLEKEKSVFEIYRKGSKVVHRQVWKGAQAPAGTFANEAAAALDLAALAKAAGKSKDVKEGGEKKVGDAECVALKVGLSADLVEEEESQGAGFEFKMFELKRIEATFYFGKADNLLKKAEFKFVKGFNAAIGMAAAGGDEEEDDDDGDEGGGGGMKQSFSTTFKLTIGAFSKETAVTVPADVKAMLE